MLRQSAIPQEQIAAFCRENRIRRLSLSGSVMRDVSHPDAFAAQLRDATPPVIARIAEGRVLFDPRTVLPGQERDLLRVVEELRNNPL